MKSFMSDAVLGFELKNRGKWTMKTKIKKSAKKILSALVALAALQTTACAGLTAADIDSVLNQTSSQTSDFGDAPDGLDTRYGSGVSGLFPSRLATNGARHDDATKVALGLVDDSGLWPATIEADATDAADADGVQNIDQEPGESDHDEKDDGLLTLVFGDDEYESLKYVVTAADDAQDGTYYLNVLFDWNKDGKWEGLDVNGAAEWAVQNHEIDVTAGESARGVTEEFLTGLDAHPVWVRATLSEVPIAASAYPAGWDGTGHFALGETEDYFLTHHQVLNLEDEDGGLDGVTPSPINPRPIPVPGGGGGGGDTDACEETFYMAQTLCKGKSVTKLLTIGGFAPDAITAVSNNPGVADVSLNEANVTISGVSEGTTTISVTAVQGNCTYYLILTVTVKDCPKQRKAMIDCCSAEEIRRDPSLCENCHVVGRQHNQTNTAAGGGMIPETDMEGRKTNISKSFVIARDGGLIDVVTLYYDCDPCAEEEEFFTDDDIANFFSELDQTQFGGEDGLISDWSEYEDMTEHYDASFDEATYECATRYFQYFYEALEAGVY